MSCPWTEALWAAVADAGAALLCSVTVAIANFPSVGSQVVKKLLIAEVPSTETWASDTWLLLLAR